MCVRVRVCDHVCMCLCACSELLNNWLAAAKQSGVSAIIVGAMDNELFKDCEARGIAVYSMVSPPYHALAPSVPPLAHATHSPGLTHETTQSKRRTSEAAFWGNDLPAMF